MVREPTATNDKTAIGIVWRVRCVWLIEGADTSCSIHASCGLCMIYGGSLWHGGRHTCLHCAVLWAVAVYSKQNLTETRSSVLATRQWHEKFVFVVDFYFAIAETGAVQIVKDIIWCVHTLCQLLNVCTSVADSLRQAAQRLCSFFHSCSNSLVWFYSPDVLTSCQCGGRVNDKVTLLCQASYSNPSGEWVLFLLILPTLELVPLMSLEWMVIIPRGFTSDNDHKVHSIEEIHFLAVSFGLCVFLFNCVSPLHNEQFA